MKKIILFLLLLITSFSFGQITPVKKLRIESNINSQTASKINVQEVNGDINFIDKSDLVDVIEANSAVVLPVTGIVGKIYLTKDNNKIYRWAGTFYSELALTDISAKVDKVTGKSLLSDAEIARLATLANYTHPTNHPPSIITQDASNRFVTDVEKSAWNAKQSAIGYTTENIANKNIANGYAGLGSDGKLIASQLPSITISDTYIVASQATMLGLSGAEKGDVAVRTDLNKSFILKENSYSTLADWQELLTPTSAVTTVFGRNGAVTAQTGDYTTDQITETTTRKFQTANQNTFNDATSSIQTQLNAKQATIAAGTTAQYRRGDNTWQTLDKTAVGLGNVDNTTDLNKPISTATQTALNGKQASGSYETAFSKNTAFNKNFGTTAGTVAE
ncbi:hypothetical protein QLS91_07980, partial [Flavobacterium sp. LB2P84]|uniref:hypothetical protein n=1 Tax=Flavobacterium yafengii TaxID=3041253 RepID=UPI0024A9DD36